MSQSLSLFNDPNCNSLNITITNANNANTACANGNAAYPVYASCANSTISVIVCKSYSMLNYTLPEGSISSLAMCRPILVDNSTSIPVLYIKQECGSLDWASNNTSSSTTSLIVSSPTAIISNSNTQSLSTTALAGISVGVFIFFLITSFLIWFIYKKKSIRKKKSKSQHKPYIVVKNPRIPLISPKLPGKKPEASTAALEHFRVHRKTSLTSEPIANIDYDRSDSLETKALHLISGLVNPPIDSDACHTSSIIVSRVSEALDESELSRLGSVSEM